MIPTVVMSNATNDKWMLIIMHGDKYWDIQAEYVLPWPEEFPMYKAFRTLYCSDGMMEDSHEELDSPERLLMKRLGTHPPTNTPNKHTIWDALKANVIAAGGFETEKEGQEGYPEAIHAILHTSYETLQR